MHKTITIDCRESSLMEECKSIISSDPEKFKDVTVQSENLHIGDAIVNGKDDSYSVIIERKTVADLISSIKDGRYQEQSLRLDASSYHNHNVVYIIEGEWVPINSYKVTQFDKSTVYSSFVSLVFLKGFSVIRTSSVYDTAYFLCIMQYKLSKTSLSMYYLNNSTNPETHTQISRDKSYSSFIKIQKKDNVTPCNIGEIMLSQIPGVSITTAQCVLEAFGSFQQLMCEINIETTPEKLKQVTYTTSSGQKRKINKSACENILNYLKGETNEGSDS